MARRRPCTPLSGTLAGAFIASGLFLAEVLLRGPPWSGWGFVLAFSLGVGLGGLVGGVTSFVHRWSVLVAVLLGPPFLLGLRELRWALGRAFVLAVQRHSQAVFILVQGLLLVAAVTTAATVSAILLERVGHRLSRLYKALLVGACLVLCAHGALTLMLVESVRLGPWLVFAAAAATAACIAFDRFVVVLLPVSSIACVFAVHLIPVFYPALMSTFAAMSFAFALLVVRRWVDLDAGLPSGDRRAHLAIIGVVLLAVLGAERIVAAHPLAWRMRAASGALSGVLYALRSTTDFDGDGHSLAFGMRDCAPFDASIGPQAHEVLDNGIDDNCLAGSAKRRSPTFQQTVDAATPRPPARARGRDLVFYVVDALRYDDAVDLRPPGFAAFLDESIVYDRAYSTSTFTSQAMMGHLAGRLPSTVPMVVIHRLNAYPSPVPRGLPHILATHGYDTALAGGMACDEGTDCRESAYFLPISYGDGFRVARLVPRGGTTKDVLAQARRAWNELDDSRPRMIWIHDLSVHDADRTRTSYRDHVRASAETFRTLREEIAPEALWVLTSDHGEEFFEHGGYRHARTLYEEVLRVPIAIRLPGGSPGRIPQVSSTRSLMPTLVALLGLNVGSDEPGPYLCLTAEGCRDQPAPAALELSDIHLHALVRGHRKIIRDVRQGVLFWFDLETDPMEQKPSFYPPPDLEEALVTWEEHVFGVQDPASVWPYRSPTD
jgi:hypothetical protein